MSDQAFAEVYKHVGHLQKACKENGVDLSKNTYDALAELSTSLSASGGNEKDALNILTTKFKVESKKRQFCTVKGTSGEANMAVEQSHENEGDNEVNFEEGEVNEEGKTTVDDKDEMPPLKRSRVEEDIHDKPVAHHRNLVVTDEFTKCGEQQPSRGHTGKGVMDLRDTRDYTQAIVSSTDASAVSSDGDKMTTQVEQILTEGKFEDNTALPKVSTSDKNKHTQPKLVLEIHNARTKSPENKALVHELAKFGEHELYTHSGNKGTTYFRAARALQLTEIVIISGDQARQQVPHVGPAIAEKIDQILKFGRVVKDDDAAAPATAPIVQDLRKHPAKRSDNQLIVDALVEYGESHLNSGHQGRGVTHLRAAKAIRDADVVVLSGVQAMASIKYVGPFVGAEIDQILEHGHIDTEDGDNIREANERSEHGSREHAKLPQIVRDVRSKPAQLAENQDIVEALSSHGEVQLAKWHTDQGTAFMRAARRLRDAVVVVTSGTVAKTLGLIGDKVVAFIDMAVAARSAKDDDNSSNEAQQ